MGEEVNYELALREFDEEVLSLCSINERFNNEKEEVRNMRFMYARIFKELCEKRTNAGRSEAGRNFSIAITDLENSCIRSIKGLYS